MTVVVFSDDEALALVSAAAAMGQAAMEARAKRIDQDGVLKRSAEMSAIKLATFLSACTGPRLKTWDELDEKERQIIVRCLGALAGDQPVLTKRAAYDVLLAAVLRPFNASS